MLMKTGRTVLKESTKSTRSSRYRCYAVNTSHSNLQRDRNVQQHQARSAHSDATSNNASSSTAHLDAVINKSASEIASIQDAINVHAAGINGGIVQTPKTFQTYEEMRSAIPDAPYESYEAYIESKRQAASTTKHGFHPDWERPYKPWEMLTNPPTADDLTLPMLLANQTHLGQSTALWHPGNSSYIFGVREGIHIISLEITLSYLRRAARVVEEVARRGGLILFVGTTKGMRDIVVTAAKRAQGYHIFTRWISGSLTNGQQILRNCSVSIVNAQDEKLEEYEGKLKDSSTKRVLKPDLVVVLNCMDNQVVLSECGGSNVPTIGIVDTDVDPTWVTYPIPANDDSLRSVGLIAGVLSRAAEKGQQVRKAAAERGRVTYDASVVDDYLKSVQDLAFAETVATEAKGQNENDKAED